MAAVELGSVDGASTAELREWLYTQAVAVGLGDRERTSIDFVYYGGEDGRFVYSPQLVRIKPGETVTFVATDKGHDAVSIAGMLPGGAQPLKVPFNKDGSFTLTEPGVYGIRCTPHVGLGMVTVIVVGEPTNLEAAEAAASKLPPKARERMQALLSQVS